MTFYPDSLNPSDTTGGTLSNNNTELTATTTSALSRSHTGYNSGLYYIEFTTANVSDNYLGVGFCTIGATVANLRATGINAAWVATLSLAVYQTLVNGTNEGTGVFSWSTFCLAINLNTQKFWVRPSPTASWTGSGNPATGTGGVTLPFSGTELFVCATANTVGQTATINFGATSFAGTVPSGYTAGWPTLTPAVPTGLAVSDPTANTLTLTWGSVSGPGSISYTLQYSSVSGTGPWTQVTGIGTNSYVLTGLVPNVEYFFQVEAVNSNANSGFSSTVDGFTTGAFTTIYRQQRNLKVGFNYINWVLSTNRAIMAHLYKLTSVEGTNDYFTDFDIGINYSNAFWKSNSLRFEGLHRKISVGLDVDEQTLKIWASPADTLFGSAFLSNAEQGLLDGATIVRYRIIWPFVTGNVASDIQQTPIAVWPLFTGYTSAISKGGSSHIEMKVKSALHKLDINMPRNYYQPACNWTLFDSGCTLLKASFAVTGTIGSGPTGKVIPLSGGIATPVGADGIANYAQGRLQFTSGVNNGLQVLIDTNDSSNLYLAYVLNSPPSAGDTVTFYPGCSKAYSTCLNKWSNENNFRGFDKVPQVMVSI